MKKTTTFIGRKGTIGEMREMEYEDNKFLSALSKVLEVYDEKNYPEGFIVKTVVGSTYVHYEVNKIKRGDEEVLYLERVESNGNSYGMDHRIPFKKMLDKDTAAQTILELILKAYRYERPMITNEYLKEDATLLMTIEFYDELSDEDKETIGVF